VAELPGQQELPFGPAATSPAARPAGGFGYHDLERDEAMGWARSGPDRIALCREWMRHSPRADIRELADQPSFLADL
jgi:hypothetical protein